ncbi:histidinol dehydrogenase [Microbacterium stercoris]|uniref:Histidinol dehydrogenase n=1 Tax=Microbacterium stercoris TaxID=2820289 RepID=A0A939QPJ7_9MICO|nr:histidinol dehydrogenase [Microbacterium stercoris]MBO3662306.1 histidinol dehydrogenase [Microbacterium stercoris]MBO3664298.1 histidinol dehydrogenase [Microbacterium stercoris]
MSWPSRILILLLALVTGAIFGVAGTVAHSFLWGVLPVGLILSLVGCAALLLGLRLLIAGRLPTWAAGLGMLAAVLIFSGKGPGGSVVVPQAAEGAVPWGLIWTYAVTGVVLLVGAWPDLSRLRPPTAATTADDGSEARRLDT